CRHSITECPTMYCMHIQYMVSCFMGRNIGPKEADVGASLQQWQRMLDDVALLYDLPTLFRDRLLRLSLELYSRGEIDALERFDMDEMARVACDGELEERLVLFRYFQPGGYYRLACGGRVAGEIRAERIYLGEYTRDRAISMYDARVQRTANGLEARTDRGQSIGRIEGKRYISNAGVEFDLVETARIIGRDVHAIEDPDTYRCALDTIQYAIELGDITRHEALVERASVSIYMPCPSCNDHWAWRE